jgi:hypothetical protein
MGLFDSFNLGNNEEEINIAAEKRQVEYAKDQQTHAAATNPNDDATYMEIQERRSDLIRWQQELEPEMFRLILSFLSVSEDEDGKIVPILDEEGKRIPALCNKRFIYQLVIPKLRPFISKNLINSNLDKREILTMQEHTANDMANMMADNHDNYGINFVNYDGVLRDLKNVIKACAWRSFKGWTKKTDSSMIKRIESEEYGKEEAKKKYGLFGS